MKILVVEDDLVLQAQLAKQLSQAGFEVDCACDGEDGLYRSREYYYDLAIIDLGLPKISGLDVIRQLRQENYQQPILILTARSAWQDKVQGLNAGGDDYLAKPFQPEEMLARIQAMLRRSAGYASNQLKQGPVCLDLQTQQVSFNGQILDLTAFEYKLLEFFLSHPGQVLSKAALNDYLYDEDAERDSNVIEVLVGRLRKKMPLENGQLIETLRGRGYRFNVQSND